MSRRQDTRIVARAGAVEVSYVAHADVSDADARLIGLGLLFEAGVDPSKDATVERKQLVVAPRRLHPLLGAL